MKIAVVARFLSAVSFATSAFLLCPILWSLTEKDAGLVPLSASLLAGLAASLFFGAAGHRAALAEMEAREAILAVTFSWLAASVIGGLPYWIGGYASTPLDAFFEAISGFTTTGATVLDDLESIPRSVLLWRSLTHWMGGMGIIVLTLAFLPASGASMKLYMSEIPGPIHEKLTPRVRDTAVFLWKVYIVLTVAQIFCLTAGGLSLFDSLTLSFATIATGGFSPYRDSIAHFASGYVSFVTAVFLFLSGANFTVYYAALFRRSLRPLGESAEFRFYTSVCLLSGALMSLSLYGWGVFDSLAESLAQGFFTAVSTLSTCGFFMADYSDWPSSTRFFILLLMFCGGCSVSSAGGITCVRTLIILRHMRDEFWRMLHPRAVIPARIGKDVLDSRVVSSCFAFLIAYLGIYLLGAAAATIFGQDMISALSGVAATLGNVGPGFDMVGPGSSYAQQPAPLKAVYILLMLCGRLEIFTLAVIFSPRFWRG